MRPGRPQCVRIGIVILTKPIFTMNDLLSLISHHGYLFLGGGVLRGGRRSSAARRARHPDRRRSRCLWRSAFLSRVRQSACWRMISGDVILYFMGRVSGWALLGLLCRLSANPETCILRSAEYFYRRGKQTLLFAKFIPGINTMSPPLAGSMKMRLGDFLQYDAVGATLYVGAYAVAGYLFSDALARHHARTALRRLCRRGHLRHRTRRLCRLSHLGLPQVPSARRDSPRTGGGTRPKIGVRCGSATC